MIVYVITKNDLVVGVRETHLEALAHIEEVKIACGNPEGDYAAEPYHTTTVRRDFVRGADMQPHEYDPRN